MISRLPKWVEAGALLLSLIAGFVNAVGLLGFDHQAVSHLSGTVTLLGTQLISSSLQTVLHLLGILLSFLIGSAIAGFLLPSSTLKLGRHYDTALFLEALLLVFAFVWLRHDSFYGHFFASAACGLQNAFATNYSGAVIRSTHVTGLFTDLGIMLGRFFRGEALDKRKVKLFLLIIIGFTLGGTAGALLYLRYQAMALLFPAAVCLVMSISYRVYLKSHPA